jgi:hypothetical protein
LKVYHLYVQNIIGNYIVDFYCLKTRYFRISNPPKSPFLKGDYISYYIDRQNVQPARFEQYVLS